MEIHIAEHSGFCMGVRKAILKIVDELNTTDEEISVYGPIIHNPQTITALENRGLKTIGTLQKIKNKIIAIRSHGVPVAEYKQIKKEASKTINLTCPRVAYVQGLIKKFANKGYYTVITGDPDHAEVVGLMSYARHGVSIISSAADIKSLPKKENYLLVSQTTFDKKLFSEIAAVFKKQQTKVEVIDTISDSTRLRQQDVVDGIKKGIDTLIVVGGKTSANTKRLTTIGEQSGVKSVHIESEDELTEEMLQDSNKILVTAGASTPGWIINNVLEKLYSIKYKRSNFVINSLKVVFEVLVRSNVVSSVAGFFASILVQLYSYNKVNLSYAIITFGFIFSMYTINNILEMDFLKQSNSNKFKIYSRLKLPMIVLAIVSLIFSVRSSLSLGVASQAVFLSAIFLGILYSSKFIKVLIRKIDNTAISSFYESKIVTSFGWMAMLLLPAVDNREGVLQLLAISGVLFAFICMRQLLNDIIALQADLLLAKKSIPIILGNKNLNIFVAAILSLSSIAFIGSMVMNSSYKFGLFFIALLYYFILYVYITRKKYIIALKYEFLVDINFIWPVVLSLAFCII